MAATDDLKELSKLLERPRGERVLSPESAARFLEAPFGEGGGPWIYICRVIMLAYAEGEKATQFLKERYTKHSDPSDWMAGPTAYAYTIRKMRDRTDEEAFTLLCFRLGRSPYPLERSLIANRLWTDYREKAEWVLLEAAKNETDPTAQLEILYYVSRTKNSALAKEALQWDWSACESNVAESAAYFWSNITPGSARLDAWSFSRIAFLSALRKTAGQQAGPEE
ncbi:MAG: hypothetical protein ISS74_04975 [Planctomycetes bacterium]|nr:hypothetical protein [Planctomycetota bacterium]